MSLTFPHAPSPTATSFFKFAILPPFFAIASKFKSDVRVTSYRLRVWGKNESTMRQAYGGSVGDERDPSKMVTVQGHRLLKA